jgi:hypothetical protein
MAVAMAMPRRSAPAIDALARAKSLLAAGRSTGRRE